MTNQPPCGCACHTLGISHGCMDCNCGPAPVTKKAHAVEERTVEADVEQDRPRVTVLRTADGNRAFRTIDFDGFWSETELIELWRTIGKAIGEQAS